MGNTEGAALTIATAVHVIQVSLTPVFLLSGVATLLNVFSTRLARVADQVSAVSKQMETAEPDQMAHLAVRLTQLHRRSIALDFAVSLGAAGGASTCATVLTLFVGEAGSFPLASMLFITFGLAIACTLSAIVAYAVEMLMASRRLRDRVNAGERTAIRSG
ncbi:MAG: DUF2721 domain-containing protein [Alphaproteobacteria bacterium]|nr:DUF2721 domain-containing protein [Alphaproteobacteria bacterium]